MPRPPPIRRHSPRSAAVACSRRGDQDSGAAMERPSVNSTDRGSSPTSIRVAKASRASTLEELIPALQQLLPVFFDQCPDAVDVLPAEAAAALQPDGIEPELRLGVVTLDVDVRRLTPVASVKEKPERP